MTMSDRQVFVEIRVRQGYGRQYRAELRLDDPDVVQAVIERAAGRRGGSSWEQVRLYLLLAIENAVLEWAQKEHPGPVQAARNPAEVLALGLANRERLDRGPAGS
jgi:hypothetical protein